MVTLKIKIKQTEAIMHSKSSQFYQNQVQIKVKVDTNPYRTTYIQKSFQNPLKNQFQLTSVSCLGQCDKAIRSSLPTRVYV